jgi:all-trans-8'-apo-beta-carotenal 15,15'-oxygenase
VHDTTLRLPDAAFAFLHDILVTENYYVILENPTRLDIWKLLTKYVPGKACIAECLYHDEHRPVKVRNLQCVS